MKKSILLLSLSFFTFFIVNTTTAATVHTTTNGWERLGSKKVNFKLDRDVIFLGAREGAFRKLKLQVTGGSLNMRKMVVEYRNGQKEIIELRHRFQQGSGSRVIDLKGNRRIIKKITFIYDSVNRPKGRATIHVFGKH